MVGLELKLQRVVFILTFQGQMRVFTVWPLFIWECRLNLAIRIDEKFGVESGGGEMAGRPAAAPQPAPRRSFDW